MLNPKFKIGDSVIVHKPNNIHEGSGWVEEDMDVYDGSTETVCGCSKNCSGIECYYTYKLSCNKLYDFDENWLSIVTNKSYNDGLNEAWELSQKINQMSKNELDRIYNKKSPYTYSYNDALNLYNSYTFKVGDIVYCNQIDSYAMIISKSNPSGKYVIMFDINDFIEVDESDILKTGGHKDIGDLIEALFERLS